MNESTLPRVPKMKGLHRFNASFFIWWISWTLFPVLPNFYLSSYMKALLLRFSIYANRLVFYVANQFSGWTDWCLHFIDRPQEIDEAARRRFVKRLYIPLPDPGARQQIMHNLLSQQSYSLSEQEIKKIVQQTHGKSNKKKEQQVKSLYYRSCRSGEDLSFSAVSFLVELPLKTQVKSLKYRSERDSWFSFNYTFIVHFYSFW